MKIRLLILGALLAGCSLPTALSMASSLTVSAILLTADQNHDNAIDVSEFSKIKLVNKDSTSGTAIAVVTFATYDKDGNLKLDQAELTKMVEEQGITGAQLFNQ